MKIFIYILILLPLHVIAQTLSGRIVRVIDGDTFWFESADSIYHVYLYGIEAPEKDQVYGPQAIANLEQYLWVDAEITIINNRNIEGTCSLLSIGTTNINKQLVKQGYAWYNRLQCINAALARAEQYARDNRLGLWAAATPTPPWDFRKGIIAHPEPPKNATNVLICTHQKAALYHKKYCQVLLRCHRNIIVVSKNQAEFLKMNPCKHCYK